MSVIEQFQQKQRELNQLKAAALKDLYKQLDQLDREYKIKRKEVVKQIHDLGGAIVEDATTETEPGAVKRAGLPRKLSIQTRMRQRAQWFIREHSAGRRGDPDKDEKLQADPALLAMVKEMMASGATGYSERRIRREQKAVG